ncbi:MAG: sulfotransferase family protein, partial [Candidatus Binatia bacterium]
DLNTCIMQHRLEIPPEGARWGWKNPRSIHLLPFFHKHFPELKFVHVVRDGRDMALSANTVQLFRHGTAILEPGHLAAPHPVKAAAFWARVNLCAASYGEEKLIGQYHLVRFESLCCRPEDTIKDLFAFLGVTSTNLPRALEEVTPPVSMGRWNNIEDASLLEEIIFRGADALRKFDYLR